ncbi:MAG: phosphoribosylformylglycinamidine cyclo-ligase [Melioribacteraceae bacterium]|nr:phosphoribosylformylglycinamidine cyclo-ligase [Melioribacteraceae bacterium]MCF8353350.1 phosphoribosylformylglycinamidine cyclo-ligase [Melioribacteraceae bacterium]MCF8393214.1 phosphoribosylformylglycinamidine cyclo-ligase [Melioribacteraceae bacterium]MCF8419076.1 phosphoribosylformylglycinamidine cyclo-ligase [Melioribacteraceae bacterium]
MSETYKAAGVDIEAGDKVVGNIKSLVKSTFSKNVLTDIGHFGAFYELDLSGYKKPVLVSSVDGVGTKLKVAFAMDKHDTVGQDLVNHCINDIAVCGAKPLYFMDYLAFGKLVPEIAEQIIKGFAAACRENDVSLIGGETAEMPGMYSPEEYDISGTIVGVVDKDEIIDGKNVKEGDVLYGLPSTGLHTNGYSLARKILFDKFKPHDKVPGISNSIGDELLKVHKSYLPVITHLKKEIKLNAVSHITGGGIIGNTKRVVPENFRIEIDWNSWEMPEIFKLIKETGRIEDDEMRHVFNLGIGLIIIIDETETEKIESELNSIGETFYRVGRIIK